MKCFVLLIAIVLTASAVPAQKVLPQLEAYTSGGLFFEKLNTDTLVPSARRNKQRLGDVSSFGLQLVLQPAKDRWLIKGGIGFSLRHYSMNKYSIGDFFTSLFLFDAPARRDTTTISYVRLTNKYLQIPVSVAYRLAGSATSTAALTAGVNLRNDFLLSSQAQVNFDAAYLQPTAATVNGFKDLYTKNAATYALTVEPYIQGSVLIYKGLGLFMQVRPFSFYASRLENRFTSSTTELIGGTVGIVYQFGGWKR
jgi:hypothetical protein